MEDLRNARELAERGARVVSMRGGEFVLVAAAEAAAGVIRGRMAES